jgi:hypothetical protein
MRGRSAKTGSVQAEWTKLNRRIASTIKRPGCSDDERGGKNSCTQNNADHCFKFFVGHRVKSVPEPMPSNPDNAPATNIKCKAEYGHRKPFARFRPNAEITPHTVEGVFSRRNTGTVQRSTSEVVIIGISNRILRQ